ncbi:photosystem II stability/assembly factor-like uncharacterized protein [Dokdonella fugitiva]|uniref:Photosystem II stability/assembly factor-like uncharacterized protein n=1 Tax=Dokdonella fugitiva TaxID=328517 RepID=A0A839F3M4_9GAMM|nr:hypothetical protein [Dokdonella fugitiva]MBA8888622.1 photosystem II stability/assembly factor-like uncharacterized protein [Dokdonella fugitiva]
MAFDHSVFALPACIAAAVAAPAHVASIPPSMSPVRTDLQGVHAPRITSAAHDLSPAGGGTWNPLGPPGGDVAVVVASPTTPSIVLAGTAPAGGPGGSLYRSTDAGTHWALVPTLAGTSVHDVAWSSDGRVYAATQDGVWTSDDAGASWTQRNLGIDPLNDATFSLAVDPSTPATVWVGVTAAAGFQSVNLMRSLDRGANWSDRTPPHATPLNGTAIAIDPQQSATVVAAFRGDFGTGEVWTSVDGGDHWQDRSAGLPGTPVNALHYDGTRLLAGGGMNFGSQYFGLYASTDLGQSWSPLHDATWPLPIVTAIAVDPADAQTIVVSTDGTGVHRTRDGGAHWDLGIGGSGALAAQSVHWAAAGSQALLVGASALGVYRSADADAPLVASSDGISEFNLVSIAGNPLDPAEVAVAFQGNNNGGVMSSTDGGVHWTIEALPPTRYSKVGWSPSGVLYAISSGPSSIAPEGLYRREADASWTGLGPDQGPLYESDLAALRFSEVDPDLILLGGSDFGVAGSAGTVWRSADAGQTWDKQYIGDDGLFIGDIEIADDGSDQVMLAPYTGYQSPDQGGLLRSDDGGASWAPVLEQSTYVQRPHLCGSIADPRVFYLGIASGWSNGTVLRSDDAGASWTPAWNGASILDIACDTTDGDTLYIAQGSGARVARSTDAGATFTPFASGLDAGGAPTELATVRSGDDARLLLATNKGSYVATLVVGDAIFADGFE